MATAAAAPNRYRNREKFKLPRSLFDSTRGGSSDSQLPFDARANLAALFALLTTTRRKLIKISVGATFPETRRNRPVCRRSFRGDQLPATPVTSSSRNINARSSSDTAGASDNEDWRASSASEVVTVRVEQEPKALIESGDVGHIDRGVLLLYRLRSSPRVLVTLEGAPLGTGGQDFGRRIKTRTPSSATTTTTILTKKIAAAHLTSCTKSQPGDIGFAPSDTGRCYVMMAGHVWSLRGRRAVVLAHSVVVREKVGNVNTYETKKPEARYH
ncbi:hypothetical protein MRX96_040450 [Rhipicephalus microplus]